MPDKPRTEIRLRSFVPRGRILDRFHIGRLRKKGMTRTSLAPQSRAATRKEIVRSAGLEEWNPDGAMGRAQLDEIYRRAGQ